MSDRRETRVLAVTAIVSLAALLGLVYLTANDMACQSPSRLGCVQIPFWAWTVTYLVVALGMLRACMGYYIHRDDFETDG